MFFGRVLEVFNKRMEKVVFRLLEKEVRNFRLKNRNES